MCEHNARRDDYILRPVALASRAGVVFDPTTGVILRSGATSRPPEPDPRR